MQITIRAIALATLCVGVCCTAFGLAKSATGIPNGLGIGASLLFMLAVFALCGAALALFKDSPVSSEPVRAKMFLDALAIWNAVIYVIRLAYPHTVGQLVLTTYEALFGNVLVSYGVFSRIYAFVENISETLPATVVALWLFGVISHRPWKWRWAATIIVVWEILIVLVLTGSSECGFPYAINQIDWAIFGVPDNTYGFRNLGLPRVLAWFIETTPVTWTSLWLYSKLA